MSRKEHLHCTECNAPDGRMTTLGVLCGRCSNRHPWESELSRVSRCADGRGRTVPVLWADADCRGHPMTAPANPMTQEAERTFEAAGYRWHSRGLLQYAAGLFQRRLNRAEDKDDDLFVNFDYHVIDYVRGEPERHTYTGWVQVESPLGTCVRIETFTFTPQDIATRLAQIEAELIALADVATTRRTA